MNTLELAQAQDIEICSKIIDEGRAFQQEQGFTQWTEDYPNVDTIRSDLAAKKGYVIKVDGVIAGYMCIDFDGEPAYNNIEGAWQSDAEYAVVHRMAFSRQFRGMGLADICWQLIEAHCREKGLGYIRIDTDAQARSGEKRLQAVRGDHFPGQRKTCL